MRLPEAVVTQLALFRSVDDAANAVSGIIAGGILPAALELLDQAIMRIIDQFMHVGYPEHAGAALIIELDGLQDDMQRSIDRVAEICKANDVLSIETANTPEEGARLWLSRRAAFGVSLA